MSSATPTPHQLAVETILTTVTSILTLSSVSAASVTSTAVTQNVLNLCEAYCQLMSFQAFQPPWPLQGGIQNL